MTNLNPNSPLWKTMEAAYFSVSTSEAHRYAAELRAIATEMPLHFDPWLQEHFDVAVWLRAEAARAEAGE